MRSGLSLPSLPEHGVADRARCKQFGFLAQSFRLVGETFFEGFDLFEAASLLLLHGAAPLLRVGRERNRAFSSPINAYGPCGDGPILPGTTVRDVQN